MNIKIMLQPTADLRDLRLCEAYWDLTELKQSECLKNHIYELSGRFNMSVNEVKRVVEANTVVVTDVECDVCGQYFMPTLPTQVVEVERQGTYRCGLCANSQYKQS